jgi:hypothetical protein
MIDTVVRIAKKCAKYLVISRETMLMRCLRRYYSDECMGPRLLIGAWMGSAGGLMGGTYQAYHNNYRNHPYMHQTRDAAHEIGLWTMTGGMGVPAVWLTAPGLAVIGAAAVGVVAVRHLNDPVDRSNPDDY